MKILHVINSMDPADGGPPVSVSGLAAAQAQLGCDVTILTCDKRDRRDLIEQAVSQIPGFERVVLSFVPTRLGLASRSGIDEAVRWADVVHLHGLWRPHLLRAAWQSQRLARKYVVAPRGMLAPWSLAQKSWKKRLGLLAGWQSVLRNAAFLHALNTEEVDQLRAQEWLDCRVEILPNGVFEEQFSNISDSAALQNLDPTLSAPYILFLGRLHHVKGLDLLADAFSIFAKTNTSVDLVVVGPDGGAKSSFSQRIRTLNLSNRVHILGPLYGTDKQAVLSGATCLCQPSRQEGFSMSITEAMASRVPVVISKNCHFPEVSEVGAGYVVDLDPQQVADALLESMADNGERIASGERARQLVLTKFTWPKIAEQSIQAYESI